MEMSGQLHVPAALSPISTEQEAGLNPSNSMWSVQEIKLINRTGNRIQIIQSPNQYQIDQQYTCISH
jgi:hypothetical protein